MAEDNKQNHEKLAQSAYEFMTEIDFNDEGKTRMVEFNLQRPIDGSPKPQDIKVQAPFLGLIPLPNLLIDDVQVDFQMEVTATEVSTEKSVSEGTPVPMQILSSAVLVVVL